MTHIWVALAVAGLIMCAGAMTGAAWSYRRLAGTQAGAALTAASFALAVSGVAVSAAAVVGAL
jgi:uncharacterized membrane protein